MKILKFIIMNKNEIHKNFSHGNNILAYIFFSEKTVFYEWNDG